MITHETNSKRVAPFGHLVDEVKPVDVGGNPVSGTVKNDIGKGDGFTGFAVSKRALDCLGKDGYCVESKEKEYDDSFHAEGFFGDG